MDRYSSYFIEWAIILNYLHQSEDNIESIHILFHPSLTCPTLVH